MATLEGQAFVAATNARLQEIGAELVLLRTDQDAATAAVMNITEDVANFKTELRATTTATYELIQQQQHQQQHDLASVQAQVVGLDLSNTLSIVDE